MRYDVSREEIQRVLSRVKYAVLAPYGRSGSLFLHGLFDQHPEVAVLPSLTDVYDFYTDDEDNFSPEEYIEFFDKNNAGLFNFKGKGGVFSPAFADTPEQDIKTIDRAEFCEIFFELCSLYGVCGRKEYFALLHIAFFLLCGKRIKDLKLILMHIHGYGVKVFTKSKYRISGYEQHRIFFQDFPEAKFITPIRDPVYSIEAFFCLYRAIEAKLAALQKDPMQNAELISLLGESCKKDQTMYAKYAYAIIHGWNSLYDMWKRAKYMFVIKWPGLHKDHLDLTMVRLCSFLGVRYDPSLTQSTFFGNPYRGTSGKVKHTSFAPSSPAEQTWEILTEGQRALMRLVFRDVLVTLFPEEAGSFFADVWQVIKGGVLFVFKRHPPHDARDSNTSLAVSFALKQIVQNVGCLWGILKEYFKLKRFRFLDKRLIHNAFSYKSTNS
jgi:hypothetical protein